MTKPSQTINQEEEVTAIKVPIMFLVIKNII